MSSACARAGWLGLLLLCVTAVGGCSLHQAPGPAGRFVTASESAHQAGPVAKPAEDSLETAIAKVRTLSERAQPVRTPRNPLAIEQWDLRLASTLATLARNPSAEGHCHVAEAYRRLGVLDLAYDHYTSALRLDPRHAPAFDGLARVWRDWGFPHLGLGDASRAVFFAPSSATARNTLGTLLQALGQRREARAAYEQALSLDPRAFYALNNLAYLSLLDGRMRDAATQCEAALRLEPALAAAHNNLALIYASTGDLPAAEREFALAAKPSVARYNIGIVDLADRRFRQAADAFDAALLLDPSWTQARARARQARELGERFGDRLGQP